MLKFTSSKSTDGPSSPGSSKLAVSGAMLLPVMTLEHSWLPHKMTNFEVKKHLEMSWSGCISRDKLWMAGKSCSW